MDCMRAMVLDYEGDGLSLSIGGYFVGTEALDSSFTGAGNWVGENGPRIEEVLFGRSA